MKDKFLSAEDKLDIIEACLRSFLLGAYTVNPDLSENELKELSIYFLDNVQEYIKNC